MTLSERDREDLRADLTAARQALLRIENTPAGRIASVRDWYRTLGLYEDEVRELERILEDT